MTMSSRNGRPGYPEIDSLRGNIVRDYEGGYGLKRIGAKYGFPWTVVRRRLLMWGVKLRPKGRPPRLAAAARAEGRRLRILQLEEAISDRQGIVEKGEGELRRVQEETPKDASTVVAWLKRVDVELHDFKKELTKLRAVA